MQLCPRFFFVLDIYRWLYVRSLLFFANILPFNSITLCGEEGCIVFWQVLGCEVIDIGVDKSASKTSYYN
jgi:hypothetical protein